MRAGKKLLARLDERRLRRLLAAFFVALAVPAALLIGQAYRQLGWEAFRNDQLLAEDLAARIDAELAALVSAEEARSLADYSFLVVTGDVAANFVQRSPLSTFPLKTAPPGALGYFQIDADGVLTSPLLPAADSNIDAASYGIGTDEARARRDALANVRGILAANRLTERAVPVRELGTAGVENDERYEPLSRLTRRRAAGSSVESAPSAAGAASSERSEARRAESADKAEERVDAERAARAARAQEERLTQQQGQPAQQQGQPAQQQGQPAQQQGQPQQRQQGQGAAAQAQQGGQSQGGQAPPSPGAPGARRGGGPRAGGAVRADGTTTEDASAPSVDTAPLSQQAFDIRFQSSVAESVASAQANARRSVDEQQAVKLEEEERLRTSNIPERRRKEQSLIAEAEAQAADDAAGASEGKAEGKTEVKVRIFESELDPIEVGWLETGHFVLFRNAWRDGRRYIQGLLVEQRAFLEGVVAAPYRRSSLADSAALVVFRGATPLAQFTGTAARFDATRAPSGLVLQRARLSPPFGELELGFLVERLAPARGPGASLLAWTSVVLAAVLVAGFLLIYRFAVGQIRLTRQQQDFVSAVSHELKTPLTSIRMYGEMLKAGWVDEAKRATYYDYIHGESERLSRLIENVLQLARLTRNTQRFDLKRVGVEELLDVVRSKAATQVERAGFTLELRNDAGDAAVTVDADCFTQIAINLVDNALKFASGAERKEVVIACRRESGGTILFTVRDFGPGIAKSQMRRIFELFYRPADGLTRETAGTGIGLALVKQLATAMGGRVDVRNCEPGAEFRLSFPAAPAP